MEGKTELELKELLRLDRRFCQLAYLLSIYREERKSLKYVRHLIKIEKKRIEKTRTAVHVDDIVTLLWRYKDLLFFAKTLKKSKDPVVLGKAVRDLDTLKAEVEFEVAEIEKLLLAIRSKQAAKGLANKIIAQARQGLEKVNDAFDKKFGDIGSSASGIKEQ